MSKNKNKWRDPNRSIGKDGVGGASPDPDCAAQEKRVGGAISASEDATRRRPVEPVSAQRGAPPDLNQVRQHFAWRHVRGWSKETATRIQSLPLQLRSQGLSSTVAVLLREDRIESRMLVRFLEDWLLEASPTRTLAATEPASGQSRQVGGWRLLEICLELPIDQQDNYLAAQDDALTLLGEAKLLASALHPSEVYRD